MNDTSTTTKPGVLAVMDAEIACLPIMAEMMTGHDGDAFDAEEAVRRMTESRATIERLAEVMDAIDADVKQVDSLLAKSNKLNTDVLMGRVLARHWPAACAALAAFRGDA